MSSRTIETLPLTIAAKHNIDTRRVTAWAVTGSHQHPVSNSTVVQVDVRATTREQALDDARTIMLALLNEQYTPETPTRRVMIETTPSWLPDPDGTPRYTARYRITHRIEQE